MGMDLGNLGNLASLGNLAGLGSLSGLLSTGSDGKVSLDLAGVTKLIQENPQAVQALAGAIGSAGTPDANTLQALRDAVTTVTAQAPAEKVSDELKEISEEAKTKDAGGFWAKLQPYLGNADNLSKFLPLVTRYAPKAAELLKSLAAGNLPFLR